MSSQENEEKLQREILVVMDEHLAEITSKLDEIAALLLIIAIPTIIAIIFFMLLALGFLALPSLPR